MHRVILSLVLLLCIKEKASAQDSLLYNKIICYDGKASIFPSEWLSKKINATATAADTAYFHSDSSFIVLALDKYPDNVLLKEIRKIYVVGMLGFSGQNFSGTNSNKDIYIASDRNNQVERTFHHEFSSILLRNHSDYSLEIKWKNLSPEIMSVSSAKAIKKGYNSGAYDTALLRKGYLDLYSLSNWENDFNMYAEDIFAGGKTFWTLADRYPKVLEKARLVIQFYKEKVWGGFSENYFRTLANE